MIKLPDIELPKFYNFFLYFPYKLILENIQRGYTASQHREFLGHEQTTGQALLSLKLKYHEIHIVDTFTTYNNNDANKQPHDVELPRWIYYYVVESNQEIKQMILDRLFPLNPIAINKEKTTMDEYFIKSDYDAGYSKTNVHFFFVKEDTFDEFPDNLKIILDDVLEPGKTHLKPSEMPYISCFGDKAKYVTSGPKDKDCIVAIDNFAGFVSQAGFQENKKNVYHGGSLFIGSLTFIHSFNQSNINTTGKNIIIGKDSSVYFSDLEDGVMMGMGVFVGENSYIGKKAIIHEKIKIEPRQSIGPYQEVKAPYLTILGKFIKTLSSGDVNLWLKYAYESVKSKDNG